MFEFGKQASRIFHIFYHSFMPGASPVFVSYSHKDAKWLERCRPFLRPLHREGLIDLWDDKRILGGDEWRNEIQQALQRAEVAVLLISQYFLDSDFILKHELPPLLQAAEKRGLKVLWLPLGHCTYEHTVLEKYQCIGEPNHPLNSLSEPEMQLVLKRLHERIREIVKVKIPATSQGEPVFLVPYERNAAFTGREDILAELDKALLKGSGALSQAAAISGLGGVGKTQTAVEYVYRHRDQYTAILWAVAENDQTLATAYAAIAQRLGLAASEEQNQTEIREAVKRWLEQHDGWLLVLDNADTPALLKPYFPRQHQGCILITSRAYTLQEIGIRGLLHLDTLPPKEACAFLFTRTERDASASSTIEQNAAVDLAKELGYLPLALEQAAAYLVETGATFSAYLASYHRRHLKLLEAGKARQRTDSVATTWDLNFAEVEKTPASGDLLRLSAFLAPDAIPLDLLALGANQLEGPLGAELARATDDPLVLDELLAPLLRYSLAKRDAGVSSFSVHRLLQTVVRERLGEDGGKVWAGHTVSVLYGVFPSGDLDFGDWPTCDRLVAHAQAVYESIARWNLESRKAADLLHQAGFYLLHRGQYTASEPLLRKALSIYEQAFGPNHPETATSLNVLAVVLRQNRDLEGAELLHRRALAIREEALGPNHPLTAVTLNNLAILLNEKGDFGGAEPLYHRALALREQALGTNHPHTAQSLNNLAELLRAKGDLDAAEPLHRRALAIRREKLAPDHPDIANSLNNLAVLLKQKGDLADAESSSRGALAIFKRTLGAGHPYTATALKNLISLLTAQGRSAEADQLRQDE